MTSDLVQRARRASDWVSAQQSADGSFAPLEAGVTPYYKSPACLATGGDFASAGRVADWVRREVITNDGDFESAVHPRDRGMATFYPYPNAWLVYGFARLGAWDLVTRGVSFLASMQHRGGGFARDLPAAGGVIDLFPSANAGLACLVGGRHAEAERAARFIQRALATQPDLDEGIVCVWDVDRDSLATDWKDSHAWRYFLANEPRRQMTFIPGMCATFLARYALASADAAAMDSARDWVRAAARNEPHIYEWPETGKVGWAAALIHGATGDTEMREIASRVCTFLCDTQADDGSWPRDSQEATLDVTAEFGVILAEMASARAR